MELFDFFTAELLFSKPTLFVTGGYFLLIAVFFTIALNTYNKKKLLENKLKDIGKQIRTAEQKLDDNTERAKMFAQIISSTSRAKKGFLTSSVQRALEGVRQRDILTKLVLMNTALIAILAVSFHENILLVILILPFVNVLLINWLMKRARRTYIKLVVESLPIAIELLIRALEAGLNVNNAFSLCATRLDKPIKDEFERINRDMVAGLSVSDAVGKFYDRVPHASVSFFSALISAQSRSGGSLAGGLTILSRSLRTRRAMENKLNALTSEPRMSMKILLAIPAVFTVISYVTQPDKIAKFFTTQDGQLYFLLILGWGSIGIYTMVKMTDIKE